MKPALVIHLAPWLVPVRGPIIEQGAVAVQDNRIVEAGPAELVKSRCPGALTVRYPDCALLPALVNSHTHLELSHLDFLSSRPRPESFTGWVEELLEARASSAASREQIFERARRVLDAQYDSGVIALADTGNLAMSREIGRDFRGKYIFFHEYLGFAPQAAEERLRELAAAPADMCCTAHAPYSTHASLLKTLKERASAKGQVFSLHVAETAGENELIRNGSGPVRAFLEKKGVWHAGFRPTGIADSGAVRYLDELRVLDERTLCVHCVQVSDEEIELLARRGAKVCLCPGSNEFLGSGRAPLERYLAAGIIPALGTDSVASNPRLSLWREMRLLAEWHPRVAPETILTMATLGGARALGLEAEYGTLEKGKKADILAVPVKGAATARDVAARLVLGDETLSPDYARADVFTSLCGS